ncbi:hypothetical protein [Sciscionella marina]|uniref:hypothetical protein n=1 Tax=Sciscionella marina TaxID=508770 RepID=UPI00037440DD|nr:hypothetical protein [Sciscionella marina]
MTVRRIEVPERLGALAALPGCDYTVAFAARSAEQRSPEQWARAVFEGGSPVMRTFLRTGWSLALGFRLGPNGSPQHVLGWRLVSADDTAAVVEQESPLMLARNVFWPDGDRIVWGTFVRYRNGAARLIWPPVSLVHVRTAHPLLRKAVSAHP